MQLRDYPIRLARLLTGLFLYALGIACTLKAQLGYAPWDVFHAGIARTTGISIGSATIAVGVLILIAVMLLKEKIGLGSIANMLLVGAFLDLILWLNIIPAATRFLPGLLLLAAGLFIIAFGAYFSISSAFGAGPRDSLMVALTRKTGLPIGACRAAIELTALFFGWRLGGMVGIGTVISALLIGVCVQIVFRLLKFDATQIRHQTLGETYRAVFFPSSYDKSQE